METERDAADQAADDLLKEAFRGALVFQGGGTPVEEIGLREMILAAGQASVTRLYQEFDPGDHLGWPKVYEKAKKGSPDGLGQVGYKGEIESHKVCRAILDQVNKEGSTTGAKVRGHFESPPYGWSGDCVDGALQVLLEAGLLKAADEGKRPLNPRGIERKSLGVTHLTPEHVNVTTLQRLDAKGVIQAATGKKLAQGTDIDQALMGDFFAGMRELAAKAGGEPPRPEPPDVLFLEELRGMSLNPQILKLVADKDELYARINEWKEIAKRIDARLPGWDFLKALSAEAQGLDAAEAVLGQVRDLEQGRQLLHDPDHVPPLVDAVCGILREEIASLDDRYGQALAEGRDRLGGCSPWRELPEDARAGLLEKHLLSDSARPLVDVSTKDKLLETLRACPLSVFRDKLAALQGRFGEAEAEAARLAEPETQFVALPPATFRDEGEIEAWIEKARGVLKAALRKGPVTIS
jgi:hypothetical protein